MTISAKQILAAIGAVLTIVAAVYGMTEYFTPRETTEMLVSDLQQNQLQIQRNNKVQTALNWLQYWQLQVNQLTAICAQQPNNRAAHLQLNEARIQRDNWQREVNRLMQN